MEIPERSLDKLSYQLQIRSDLINNRTLQKYPIADGGTLKAYDFELIGEEQLDTPAGKFDTLVIRRLRENDKDRNTTFWLAKDWDYLVVKSQQDDDGKSYDIDLEYATQGGEKVEGK